MDHSREGVDGGSGVIAAVTRLAAILLVIASPATAADRELVDYVDPRIDTVKPRWIYFASASRPFGMVALSPDTVVEGDWGASYVWGETHIRCFSHLHDWQLAGVPVMPAVGRMDGPKGYEAYKARFSHDNETVSAGYHKVVLPDVGVEVELTSTTRVGWHRYRFPITNEAYVLFDVGAPIAMTKMQDSGIRKTGPRSLAGYSVMAPTIRRPKPVTVYFVADFDRDLDEFGGWQSGHLKPGVESVKGQGAGGFIRFRITDQRPVVMKVALSFVSEENARKNMTAESPGWDFDQTVRTSRAEWNEWLGRIRVEGGTDKQRVKFYTDLWHALLGRRTFSDADGRYVDNTGPSPRIRQVPIDSKGLPQRSTFNSDSFWGSHWNLNILWSMAYPRLMSEMVSSLVDYYHTGGMIARGPAGGNYTFVMIGDQAVPLIAAAYNKGIRDFDVNSAYEGSRKNAFLGGIRDRAGYEHGANPTGGGMSYYLDRGYVPVGIPGAAFHREGAAQSLEYAYSDWCLSQFAGSLGKKEDAELFLKRSENWKKLWDAGTGWIRPRNMDGSWLTPFEPVCQGSNCRGFVESNSAIYSYFVPHDVPGLIAAVGGNDKFIEKLSGQFEKAAPHRWITPHGKHGENWVDYENQPSCHMAHLFSHAGAPWLTQQWVRRIKEEVFGVTTPFGGYNGDEDQGQMGALGVLMAIGLFDVQGGAAREPRYEITSPIFQRVEIELDRRYYQGRRFVIRTRGQGTYIQRARLNGREIVGRFWITHEEFARGGTLELDLGPEPDKQWGVPVSRAAR